MDLLKLEKQRAEIIAVLNQSLSVRKRIFLLSEFVFNLSEFETVQIRETYLNEFYSHFLNLISSYEPFGVHPDLTKKVIEAAQLLFDYSKQSKTSDELIKQINRVSSQYKLLIDVLHNKTKKGELSESYLFPVLEEDEDEQISYGLIDSITVTLQKADKKTFIIVPSEKQIESRIKQQVNSSWFAAVDCVKEYRTNPKENLKVVIEFNKRLGNYRGDSVGVVLTLAFIRKLLTFYNSPVEIIAKQGIAFTGKMDQEGRIYPVTEKVIRQKAETIFYSPVERFVVFEEEKELAERTVRTLKKDYPDRDLKVIGTENLHELLNRRDAVDIKKRSLLKRFARSEVKNYTIAVLLIGLLVLLYFSGLWDWDTNPSFIEQKGTILSVYNKNGNKLWSQKMMYDTDLLNTNSRRLKTSKLLFDINYDGINEVFLSDEAAILEGETGRISCYNNQKELNWSYVFRDQVFTPEMKHSTSYLISIVDIRIEKDNPVLYAKARNHPLYPGAIFKLDARTGERIDSTKTLWNSGSINIGIIEDWDNDGKEELIYGGVNNGYETAYLASIEIDKIEGGTSPAPDFYSFVGKEVADFENYFLLPKTDVTDIVARWNTFDMGYLMFDDDAGELHFILLEFTNTNNDIAHVFYRYSPSEDKFYIDCGDDFQKFRDSLVVRGILDSPLTYTGEYFKSLKEQIRYWDGKQFVKKEDYR